MLHNRGRRLAQPLTVVAVVMVLASVVRAEDSNSVSSQYPQYPLPYQAAPGPVPSGNIIG